MFIAYKEQSMASVNVTLAKQNREKIGNKLLPLLKCKAKPCYQTTRNRLESEVDMQNSLYGDNPFYSYANSTMLLMRYSLVTAF